MSMCACQEANFRQPVLECLVCSIPVLCILFALKWVVTCAFLGMPFLLHLLDFIVDFTEIHFPASQC